MQFDQQGLHIRGLFHLLAETDFGKKMGGGGGTGGF